MHDEFIDIESSPNERKSLIISSIIHALLLLLLLIPVAIQQESKDEEIQGILVQFGDPEAGNTLEDVILNSENPDISQQENASTNEDIITDITHEESPVVVKEKKEKPKEKGKETPVKTTTQNQTAENKNTAPPSESKKKEFSDLFNKSKGTNNTSGTQGDESGKPDGKVLEGMSKGSGRIGGGLAGRGIIFEPTFNDNTQKTGKVALTICVDNNGKVIKSDFTQKGSTTADPYLINLARQSSMKYIFTKSELDSQCGTVTIDFKVQ